MEDLEIGLKFNLGLELQSVGWFDWGFWLCFEGIGLGWWIWSGVWISGFVLIAFC
jgi:hypothetical protein